MGRVSELQVREAIANFNFTGRLKDRRPFGSGHINDTYLLTFEIGDMGDMSAILQRMNREIFLKPVELMENIVAQMLAASGHVLYFYSNSSRNDADARMEIDFLIAKSRITSRHNISPIEVKSGNNYTLNSLNKFRKRYHEQLHTAYVVHTGDLKVEDEIIYLPVYMVPFL